MSYAIDTRAVAELLKSETAPSDLEEVPTVGPLWTYEDRVAKQWNVGLTEELFALVPVNGRETKGEWVARAIHQYIGAVGFPPDDEIPALPRGSGRKLHQVALFNDDLAERVRAWADGRRGAIAELAKLAVWGRLWAEEQDPEPTAILPVWAR